MAGTVRIRSMKSVRYILIPIIILICFISSMAQIDSLDTRKEAKHYIGIKAGQNYSWIKLDPRVRQNGLLGPVLGISYSYFPQHFASIVMEAQYIKYGWEEVFLDSANSYSRELTYLEFPVLTNFVIGKKNTHLKFQAGIKLAVLLNDLENSDLQDSYIQYYNGLAIEDTFELGLAMGISLSHILPLGELQLDLRYNSSLSNLFPPADDLRKLLYSQNQGISLSLYYWFKIR